MNRQKGETVATASAVMSTTSLSQLFAQHNRRVLMAAYRITGSMADAEDVTQAVFLRLAALEGPIENAGSYLYRSAMNGALDLLRRRKAAATESLDLAVAVAMKGPGGSPEAEASGKQLGDALRSAISELPAKAAEMFALRYLEDFGNREIASMMGTSQAVVAVTLHNARSRLKKKLLEMDGAINAKR